MTTPNKEGLKFSDEERRKADDCVEDLRNGGKAYWQIAVDAVRRLNRAKELLERVDHWADPYGREVSVEIDDFLTSLREEREP